MQAQLDINSMKILYGQPIIGTDVRLIKPKDFFGFSLEEQKIFCAFRSVINPIDLTANIQIKNLSFLCNLSIESLRGSFFTLVDKSSKLDLISAEGAHYKIFENANYDSKSGFFSVTFGKCLNNVLLRTQKYFSNYSMLLISRLTSKYAIRLFRLFLNLGYIEDNKTYERVFYSDDFKQIMFAPKKNAKFYDDIVKTSIRLIKANTGYDIQYSIFKDGNTNKITRISFLVTPHCFRGF